MKKKGSNITELNGKKIKSLYVSATLVNPKSHTDISVDISEYNFSDIDSVTVNMASQSEAYQYGLLNVSIQSFTNKKIEFRVYNADTVGRSPGFIVTVFGKAISSVRKAYFH